MKTISTAVIMVTSLAFLWIFAMIASAEEVPRITAEQLKGILASPDVAIIDVRANLDWVASNLKIKGATREDPRKVNSWMEKYPKEKTLVFYCS